LKAAGRALLFVALVALGCGDNQVGLTGPSFPPRGPTSVAANLRPYLDELLTIMHTYSINRASIDWGNFRSEVLAASGSPETIADIDRAIVTALRLLDDEQTYYRGADGRLIGPPPVGGCTAATSTPPILPDTIGYVRIDPCDCDGPAATRFAESLQQAIRAADRPGLTGWIVDLRGNFGGNMWPMIAGIGPVLGEGIVGWIVYNDREYEREYRDGAARSFGEIFAQVGTPYTLLRERPKVAVLTDGVVASSGEAITVYFKGRPRTRSFGTATCGHHHLQQSFRLSDGAVLFLAVSQHADRTKKRYAARIGPDEVISDPVKAVDRAIEWLQVEGDF
jgi:hypothetical protein